ncbi:hypothetical protein KCU96_g19701, partial [Aureobasidium melanogenum]
MASTTAALKESVKETLLGVEDEPQLSSQMRAEFMQHAKTDPESGDHYMGQEEFVNAIAPESEDYHKIKRAQYAVLFSVADRRKTGRVTLSDWATFNNLLAKPDAEYEIAFRLFCDSETGVVDFNSFKEAYARNRSPDNIPFDWNSTW